MADEDDRQLASQSFNSPHQIAFGRPVQHGIYAIQDQDSGIADDSTND